MRRREHRDVGPGPPRHLVEFDAGDWPDPGPPPEWWRDDYPWGLFKRRIEWVRARQRWVAQQEDVLAARTALDGPDYARGCVR